jgi:hypothetical protein
LLLVNWARILQCVNLTELKISHPCHMDLHHHMETTLKKVFLYRYIKTINPDPTPKNVRWNCLKVIKDVRLFFLKEMFFRCADKHGNGAGKASNKQVNTRCLYDSFLRKCSIARGIIMNLECLHTHNVWQKGGSYYQLIDRQGPDPHIARETQCTHFWWKWIYLILKLQINHPQNCESPFNKQVNEYCHLQAQTVWELHP